MAPDGNVLTVDGNEREADCVSDNGAGFDMQFAGNLFQPFVRMHSALDCPGTGIGLATVTRIVQWHRGEIWTECAEQQGTALYFTLAAASASLST